MKIFSLLVLAFSSCLHTYPPENIHSTGRYDFVRADLILNGSSFPYTADEIACGTYMSFRAFDEVFPEHEKRDWVKRVLANIAVRVVDPVAFKKTCQVATTQAAACVHHYSTSDTGFWTVIIDESLFVNYSDVPGEPVFHELTHVISKFSTTFWDRTHFDPNFWAAKSDSSIQAISRRNFAQFCLSRRDH